MLALFPAHRDFPSLVWLVCFAAISGSLWHTLSLSALNAGRLSGQSPSSLQPLVSRAATSCLSHPGSCSLPLVASWSQGVGERELLVRVPSHTFFPADLHTVHLHSPSHPNLAASSCSSLGAQQGQQTWGPAEMQSPSCWCVSKSHEKQGEFSCLRISWYDVLENAEREKQNRKRKRDFWIFKAGLV